MTQQEAIKRIQKHNKIHSKKERNHAIYITEALNMACEALDMQIPRKPITQEEYSFICPICQQDLGITQEDISIYDMTPPRHCECGQALDWSDT